MSRWVRIDLHVHTGLSPCADKDMTPWNIVRMAQLEGIHLLAITDHNCTLNAGAVIEVGTELGLVVLPGMEVQTKEEVHLIAIFPTFDAALAFQDSMWEHLPDLPNRPEIFGEQILYDSEDRPSGFVERLLMQSVKLGIEEVGEAIVAHSGLTIAAHINRRSYSLIGQLGLIPPGLELDAVEIDKSFALSKFREGYGFLNQYPMLRNSDAHQLVDLVGNYQSEVLIEEVSFAAVKEVLRIGDSRRIRLR